MSERFIRIHKKFHLDELKTHLMTYGALSGTCANCKEMDLRIDALQCPGCKTDFKYIAFQNVRDHMPKMQKISHERPNIVFVDYDDFKRLEGEEKAKGILG
ncbi:MAG: hypothetical protein KGJ09_03120 [Candidatus Omnitrophica bacterium]|nr:hypothetical protein [Candidatus Omnitrophota bacterium]MDE2009052.1 hypothetical protein [Candidatus Omnitrophota bacterium]MDE2214283.1 hypothetical protein [Candidatus Omnitrophota bacterium]MDE2231320.1 hypothetical protein [Candidatus Omnitrophota bacterium]